MDLSNDLPDDLPHILPAELPSAATRQLFAGREAGHVDALSYSYLLDVAIETGARDERGLDARRNQIAPRSGIGAVRRIGKPGALGPIAAERALAVWDLLEQVLLLS